MSGKPKSARNGQPSNSVFLDTLNYLIFKCETSFMVLLFAFASAVMAVLGVSHCTFVTGLSDFRPGGKHTVGLYSLAVYDENGGPDLLGCVNFPEDVNMDAYFRLSRAAGAISAACMMGSFLILIRTILWAPSRMQWTVARFGLLVATVSSVLTFAIKSSSHCQETDCKLAGMGIVTIFNAFIMAGLALILWIEPPPVRPLFVYWSEEHYIAGRDTVAIGEMNRPEFVSSQDIFDRASSQGSDAGVGEDGAGDLVFPNSQGSVFSQVSVQDSLVSSTQNMVHRYSSFRFALLGTFGLAWLLSVLGIRHCTFLLVGREEQHTDMYMGVGLYTRAFYVGDDNVGCIAHSDANKSHFDGYFQASRVLGAVASLLLCVAFLVGIAQLFSNLAKVELWLFVRFLLPCAFVAEALMFLVYASDLCNGNDGYECIPGAMGYTVMGNLTLLFTLCAVCCVLPPPSSPVFTRFRREEEEEEFSLASSKRKKIKSMLPPPNSHLDSVDEEEESSVESEADGHGNARSTQPSSLESQLSTESNVNVRVEVSNGERKTIREITQPDGSTTMTTTIEDLSEEQDLESEMNGYGSQQKESAPYYMT